MIDYLISVPPEIELIGEEHPRLSHRVRNTNIVALHKHSSFISSVLEKIKEKLNAVKHAFGPEKVFYFGSGVYINEFGKNTNRCIYTYPFAKKGMLFHRDVGFKGIKKWQNTHELIFFSN